MIGVIRYEYDVDCDLVYLRYLPHRLCADFHDYFKKLSQDCTNVKKIPRLENRGISCILYSMKIKKQTRKLAAGCSKHCFEVADKTDEVRNHTYVKVTLTRFEEIFESIN